MNDYGNSSSRRRTSNTGAGSSSRRASNSRKNTYPAARGTGKASGRGQSAGHSAKRNGHHNRRRRKNEYDITQILMYGIGAIILILAIALAVKACGKTSATGIGESSESSSESESGSEEAKDQITVDGVAITGMSQEEAREAILKQFNWGMKVKYDGKEASVNNILLEKVNNLLEEIYAGDMSEAKEYEIDTNNLAEAARAEAALVAGNWNMVAKNGGISGYDKESGKFTFTEGTNGLVIDQEKLAQDMVEAVRKKEYSAVLEASVKEVSPELSAAQLKEKYKTISTYTTKTTSNSNRNENIRLACEALNGTIINPGQEFSFNNTTGARTEAKGYKPATAYLYGEIVQEPGGGVCQVSSTLYNAVIFAGLKSTERQAHSYEPSYVTPGEDAAVSFGGPDFKFVNNSDFPVAIKTSFANQELTISIYGVQILKDGEKIRMDSERTGNIDPPAPVYEEDQTLQLTEEKIAKEAVPGSRWATYLVRYQDGKEVGREFFHNSAYRGKSAIIKRNTSGVVITTEAESSLSEESLPSEGESIPVPDGSQGPASGPGETPLESQGPESPGGPPTVESPVESPGQSPGGGPVVEPTNPVVNVPAGPGSI